jgi:RNA-binding protein
MRSVSAAERRDMRAKAHHLRPVVAIGQHGLTPAVLHEIDVNLLAHELIKIRAFSDVRDERDALLERICTELDAAPVQHIGKLFVIWRPTPVEAPAQKVRPVQKAARSRPRTAKGGAKLAPPSARAIPKTTRTRTLPMGKSAPQARRPREPNARGVARPPAAGMTKVPRSPPSAPRAPAAGAGARRRRKAI